VVFAPFSIAGQPCIYDFWFVTWLLEHNPACFRHTRNLLLGYRVPEETICGLMNACVNLRDLNLYLCGPFDWSFPVTPFERCSITHLTCSLATRGLQGPATPTLDAWPCTSTLTHVHVDFPDHSILRAVAWLQALPCLSHLAVPLDDRIGVSVDDDLPLFPTLKCLILVRPKIHSHSLAAYNKLGTDPRVVIWIVGSWGDRGCDWQVGHADVGADVWSKADELINTRKGLKESERSRYALIVQATHTYALRCV
jgi:hypothetical protein